MIEKIYFIGHEKVSALHSTTIEVTTEDYLTEKGDCIIGILASKSASMLSNELKEKLRKGKKAFFTIVVKDKRFSFHAFGDERLLFSDQKSIVIRKSSYIDGRTVAIKSSASASSIPREIVKMLKEGSSGEMLIEV